MRIGPAKGRQALHHCWKPKSALGASSSLRCVRAKVSSENAQRPLRLGGREPVFLPQSSHPAPRLCPKKHECGCTPRARIPLCHIEQLPVTEAQKNPSTLDSVRDCLFEPINGVGRGNRLANADRLMALV